MPACLDGESVIESFLRSGIISGFVSIIVGDIIRYMFLFF